MTIPARCRVFIGSSSEGKDVARALQYELLPDCEVILWDQGVFEPSQYTLDALIEEAHRCDFAVLVATPDDTRESRGRTGDVPRDNVILEFGLFAGVLGRERTFVLATGGVSLPTDTLGLTRLAYHEQTNPRAAVSEAAGQVRVSLRVKARRTSRGKSRIDSGAESPLEAELGRLRENAQAQGWRVSDSMTALRIISPKRKTHTLIKSTPQLTRENLRPFVAKLRADGLRVSSALRRTPEESPFS